MVVSTCDSLMPILAYRQTEFYTDFAHRFETDYILGTSAIPIARGVIGHLGVHRGGSRPFDGRSQQALQVLVPHLQRALQLRRRFGTGLSEELGFRALEALSLACIICDGRGAVIFANAAASAIEAGGHGISLSPAHGITAVDPAAIRGLAVLVADATHGGSGGSLLVNGLNGGQVAVLVTPLPARFAKAPGHALVTMRSTNAPSQLSAQLLAELFGLTPAEARLAIGLAEGRSLMEMGNARAVSENTLRTQLASTLRKTGTSNQRELVRLLGLLPPVARRD
jgi:DNA-binding CsgD family transcriptional regulator